MKIYFIYVTFGSLKEAQRLGGKLVKNKLAACTNIIPTIYSTYVWKKKNHDGQGVFNDSKNLSIKGKKGNAVYH